MWRRLAAGIALVLCLIALSIAARRRSDPLADFPRTVLWAWERPEDLRFIRPGTAGIAFLARTVWLEPGRVTSKPRLQPLRYPPGTPLMAVVRFESRGQGLPPRADAIRELRAAAAIPDVRALQIDFDARQSERRWYAALLEEARGALPKALPLTMTALASWCEQDGWIRDLPVADATPMLFRMGPGERAPTRDFAVSRCRSSVGVSMDELPATVPGGRRLYFFDPRPWTQDSYRAAVAQARRWQ